MSPETREWYPAPTLTSIGNGATIKIHLLSGPYCQAAVDEIKAILRRKWGMPSTDDTELEEIQRELNDLGYSLVTIAAGRGDDRHNLTASQQKHIQQTERGHICEVLAEMAQRQTRGIPVEDIFSVFNKQITIAISEHGIDYIAFKFDDMNEGLFPNDNESIVLGESKYTSEESNLHSACKSTSSWISNSLTKNRLYQEVTLRAAEYKRFGHQLKAIRAIGFIQSIYKRDERLIVSSTMLYPNSVSDSTAVSNFDSSLIDTLNMHKDGSIPHERFEALLFKVIDLSSFCESCWEDFRCEPE